MNHCELELYAYPFRSRAERVIWALDELELEYRLVRLDPSRGENRSDAFLKLNPGGKIPVLVQGKEVITESMAIMEHLDNISGSGRLIPAAAEGRVRYHQLVYFMMSEIESYLWIADQATRLNRLYSWPPGTADAALEKAEKNLPILYQLMADREYLVGDAFTAADIYAFHLVIWAGGYQLDVPDPASDYLDRLQKRPACPDSMKPAEK